MIDFSTIPKSGFFLTTTITVTDRGRACRKCGREERCVQVLVGKPEGMRPLG
jgi:hypothetical protein